MDRGGRLGRAVGLVLGGLLTTGLSWRYVLFINVPIGIALLAAAAASLVPSPPRRDRARLDLPGALTVTGWGSAPVIAALAAAAGLLAAFGLIEAHSAAPLVPPGIVRQRRLAVGNAVMTCLGAVMTSGFFVLSLYLQQILGYSALRTGMAIVPLTVVLVAGPLAARRLLPRFGPRSLLLAGGILTTAGLAWMAQLPDSSAYLAHVLGPIVVIGAGIGLMLLPLAASATAGLPRPPAPCARRAPPPGKDESPGQPSRPRRRIAFCLTILGRISGLTSSLSKSRNQRSGVSSG